MILDNHTSDKLLTTPLCQALLRCLLDLVLFSPLCWALFLVPFSNGAAKEREVISRGPTAGNGRAQSTKLGCPSSSSRPRSYSLVQDEDLTLQSKPLAVCARGETERSRCKSFLTLALENPPCPLPGLISHQISMISKLPTKPLLFVVAPYSCQVSELLFIYF